MYGIDIVIPDFSYLIANRSKIVGMVITHGHEDHIGAIPYLPATPRFRSIARDSTLGLVENKLKEHEVIGDRTINAGDKFKLGEYFDIEQSARCTYNRGRAICLAITTPAGGIPPGDFKIDYTSGLTENRSTFSKLAQIGKKGVTLMLCDSTNAGVRASSL